MAVFSVFIFNVIIGMLGAKSAILFFVPSVFHFFLFLLSFIVVDYLHIFWNFILLYLCLDVLVVALDTTLYTHITVYWCWHFTSLGRV